MKISVIVPVYNAEKFLNNCIESVVHQSYTNWELLLIDDGSSDSRKPLAKMMLELRNFIKKMQDLVLREIRE